MRVIKLSETEMKECTAIQQPVIDELLPMVKAMIDAYLQAKMGQVDEATRDEAYATIVESLSWEISNAFEVFMVVNK